MSNFTQVDGHRDLVRDNNSGAIINRNRSAYEIARKRAADAQKQRDEIRSATREINTLKCEMHEIKDMLKILLDRN
jgi:trehalose-6-phosphatase